MKILAKIIIVFLFAVYGYSMNVKEKVKFIQNKYGVKFVIDTDSHATWQMDMMKYGVSVARRGWATKSDILNSLPYNEFVTWLRS